MGILNRLWAKVWETEEEKKKAIMHAEIAKASNEAEERRRKNTPIQDACMKHGGPDREALDARLYGNVTPGGIGQSVYLSKIQQVHAAQNHASTYQQMIAMASNTGTSSLLNTAPLGSHIHTQTVWGLPPAPPGIYGAPSADSFYLALRGIEQASMKKPGDNHRYDDLALDIQDYRYLNTEEISLIGLTSFCLSNVMEVEPVLMLLEGYGMKVV